MVWSSSKKSGRIAGPIVLLGVFGILGVSGCGKTDGNAPYCRTQGVFSLGSIPHQQSIALGASEKGTLYGAYVRDDATGTQIVRRTKDESAWTEVNLSSKVTSSGGILARGLEVHVFGTLSSTGSSTGFGVHGSTDGGTTWEDEDIVSGVNSVATTGLITDSAVFVVGSKLRKSTDHGTSWSTVAPPKVSGEEVTIFSIIALDNGNIATLGSVAAGSTYLSVSADGGTSWTNSAVKVGGQALSNGYLLTVLSGGRLAAYGMLGGVSSLVQSSDQGATWTLLSRPGSVLSLQSIDRAGRVYGFGGGIFAISSDFGVNWEPVYSETGSLSGFFADSYQQAYVAYGAAKASNIYRIGCAN